MEIDYGRILPKEFYLQDTREVARRLLGKPLMRVTPDGIVGGTIVETEAYLEGDPASHGFPGKTPRNSVMFGSAGHAYVYLSYGIHEMLNIVTSQEGCAEAVLIRAAMPTIGVELMRRNRNQPDVAAHLLASGPGRLAQAFGIARATDNGVSLTDVPTNLWIEEGEEIPDSGVVVTTRIGISKAVDKPWRYYSAGSSAVSRKIKKRAAYH